MRLERITYPNDNFSCWNSQATLVLPMGDILYIQCYLLSSKHTFCSKHFSRTSLAESNARDCLASCRSIKAHYQTLERFTPPKSKSLLMQQHPCAWLRFALSTRSLLFSVWFASIPKKEAASWAIRLFLPSTKAFRSPSSSIAVPIGSLLHSAGLPDHLEPSLIHARHKDPDWQWSRHAFTKQSWHTNWDAQATHLLWTRLLIAINLLDFIRFEC